MFKFYIHLMSSAILFQAEIIRLASRQTLLLPGHTSYVQGVTWDPLNQYVVTQSSDRTCKVHQARIMKSNIICFYSIQFDEQRMRTFTLIR
jgi:hypothetical protein